METTFELPGVDRILEAPSSRSVSSREEVLELIRMKATNLHQTKQMLCAEVVFLTFNNSFGHWMKEEQAISLMSAFGAGIGGVGCLCGSVSGGLAVLGLALEGRCSRREVRAAARLFINRFKDQHRSTCCHVLTKPVRQDKKGRCELCTRLSASAAVIAGEILFDRCPEYLDQDWSSTLSNRDNWLSAFAKRVLRRLLRML